MYGTNISNCTTVKEWREASGITWEVKEAPASFINEDGESYQVEDKKVLYRSDINKALGIMSNRYETFQPKEVFEFFKEVIDVFEIFRPESCGISKGGKKIWAMAKSKEDGYNFGGDIVQSYLLVATSFDGSMPTIIQPNSYRVFCANQFPYLLRHEQEGQHRVKHFKNMNLQAIKESLHIDTQWLLFGERVEQMISTKITPADTKKYYEDILGVEDEKSNRVVNQLTELAVHAPGNDCQTAKGTLWGALNGLTYYVDHIAGRSTDARIDSAMFGQRAGLKEKAYEKALQLV